MDALRFTTSGNSGWTNVMFCALLYLSTQIVPILGLIVMCGFFAEVHRRLVLRHPEPYVAFRFFRSLELPLAGRRPVRHDPALALPFAFVGVAMAVVILLAAGAGAASALGGNEDSSCSPVFGIARICFVPFMLLWLVLSNAAVTRAELTGDLSKSFTFGRDLVLRRKDVETCTLDAPS